MNETYEFSKQHNVCSNEITSLDFGVVLGYVTWIFCELFCEQSR